MKHLTVPQVEALIEALPEHHRLLFRVIYNHGLRVSEALALTSADVRDGFLTVRRLKGSRKTIQRLADNERAGLEALAGAGGDGPLFPLSRSGVWRIMQDAGKRAGIPAHLCHPHAAKHSIAHHALDAGLPLNKLQAFLGHVSLSSTGMYLLEDATASADETFRRLGL